MDKILLIIKKHSVRQLYHELLLDKQYEIIAVDSLAKALCFMIIDNFSSVIIFSDGENDVELFLKIRNKRKNWRKIKLVLLTKNNNSYKEVLQKNDKVIVYNDNNHQRIVQEVRQGILSQ